MVKYNGKIKVRAEILVGLKDKVISILRLDAIERILFSYCLVVLKVRRSQCEVPL